MTKTISILSHEGDTTVTAPAEEILDRIKQEAKRGKWVYFGTSFKDPNTITLDELVAEEEPIVLTNALVGG